MSEKDFSADCAVCLLGPLIKFTSILGAPYFLIKCSHNNNQNEIEVYKSRFYMFSATVVIIFLIIGCICCVHSIYIEDRNDILILVALITDLLYYIRSLLCVVMAFLQSKLYTKVILGSNEIFKYHQSMKTGRLLSKEEAIRIRSVSFITCYLIVLLLLSYGIYVSVQKFTMKLFLVEKLALIFGFYVDLMIFMTYVVTSLVYNRVIERCYENLKTVLSENLKHDELDYKIKFLKTNEEIFNYLSFIRRVHGAVIWNIKYFGYFCDPQALIWLIIAIATLIINAFIILASRIDGISETFIPGFIELELQLCINAFVIVYVLISMQKLQIVVSISKINLSINNI